MKFDNDLKFICADENEDQLTGDRTEELEEEELETAAEEDDDEDDDPKSDGQKLYEFLKTSELIDDGDWEDITGKLKRGWDAAAAKLDITSTCDL